VGVAFFSVIKLCLQRGRRDKKALKCVYIIYEWSLSMIVIILLSTGVGWMARLAEISVGIGLGLHIPSQQLMVAETALPHQRYVYFTAH
jgi:hypothetical protein